jgi:hypothetical protein
MAGGIDRGVINLIVGLALPYVLEKMGKYS